MIPLHDKLHNEDAAGLIINPISAAAFYQVASKDGAKSFVATGAGSQLGRFSSRLAAKKAALALQSFAVAISSSLLGNPVHSTSLQPKIGNRFKALVAEHGLRVMIDAVRARGGTVGEAATEYPYDFSGFIYRSIRSRLINLTKPIGR